MSDNVVQVSIRGDASSLSSATKEAGSAMGGLTGALKEWRTHVRTESRYTNFLAAQVAGLGIASKGAAAEFTGLISAFAFGGGIGVAIEAVKIAAHAMHGMAEAEAAANEELKKLNDELVAGTEKVKKWDEQTLLAMQGASKAQLQANLEIKPLIEERAELEKKINDAALKIVETREKGNGKVIEASSALAAIDEAELARMRARLDLLNKMIPARQLALAPVAQEQAKQDTEKEGEDEADRLKRVEKLRVDHLRRVAQAESDAAKALQKMGDDQLAWRVQEDEKYNRIEDERDAEHDKEVNDRFEELKKQVHSGIGEATRFGAAFGTAFAGIAAGTLSVTKGFQEMTKAALHLILDSVRKAIEAYALQAAAAAAAAHASVPFGIFVAAAAAAAMEALVMGLLGSLPSAAVGMPRVPADMPVMVHRDEAILTKGQAEDWRGGGGGGGVTHNHYWQAIDGDSVRRLVERPEFIRAFGEAQRNGRIR